MGEVSVSDERRLVGDENEEGEEDAAVAAAADTSVEQPRPWYSRHRWCLILSLLMVAIAVGHVIAVYFIYFRCNEFNG